MDEPLDCERLPHDSDRGRHPCPRGGDESIGLLQHAATTMESRGEERRPRGRKRARRQRLADVRIAEGVCRSPRPDRSAGDALLRRHVPAHLPDGRPHPVRQLAGTRVEGLPVRSAHGGGERAGQPALLAGLLPQLLPGVAHQDYPRSFPLSKGADGLVDGWRTALGGRGDQQHHVGHGQGVPGGALRRRAVGRPAAPAHHHGHAVAVPGPLLPRRRRRRYGRALLLVLLRPQGAGRSDASNGEERQASQIRARAVQRYQDPETVRMGRAFPATRGGCAQGRDGDAAKDRLLLQPHELCLELHIFPGVAGDLHDLPDGGLARSGSRDGVRVPGAVQHAALLAASHPGPHRRLRSVQRRYGPHERVSVERGRRPQPSGQPAVWGLRFAADAVTIRQASFSWHRQERLVLQDVDVRIAQGQLVAVVGQVGCGKTSFLSAILGELRCVKGSINRKGKVAYVAQQAWIQNATVRQNILLKRQHHSCFYDRVILACQLQTDLAELPAGDQTELGMRGVNLSGGQKQRINLARAVYQNADLYIMDDPLSAVDAQVGSALFHGVIGPRGLLRKKTRVLATNTLSLLPLTDMVIVLHEGRVKEVHRAPFGQRLFEKGLALKALIAASPPSQQPQHHGTTDGGAARAPVKVSHDEKSYDVTSGDMSSLSVTMAKRPNPQGTLSGYAKPGQLIEDEAFHVGKVEYEIYRDYVKRFGPVMFVVMLLSYAACRAFDVLSSVWISSWSEEVLQVGGNASLPDSGWRLSVYGLLGVCQGLAIFLGTLVLGLCALAASGSLHDEALGRLVRAPMSFFDTTPLGRMLNRFSKDLDQADIQIGLVVDCVLEQLSDVLGILLLITLYIPTFLPAVAPCALVYFVVQKLFVRTFRQLQRLESVSRSPVFNCIAETVPGVQTIRAYAVQRAFVALTDALLERWISCAFHLMAAERWLTVRLNFLGTAVSLVTACLLVHGRDSFGAAVIGLTLLYSLRLTDALNFLVRFTAELENSLISVERLHEYTKTPTEAPWRVTPAPSSDWPQEGAVQFVNFSTRYRKDLDLVLRHINLEIQPSEKVGVVGRTGSGKSSLTLSMFRILEPAEGDIVIDGVAISRIGLHDLRSKITIIPQEPILFCGSLRLNLDPKGERTDDQVWAALNKAHLSTFFQDKAEKLDFVIEEDGKNLSIGQHQLICLARALLRNTRLLILDEATASVDPDTDVLVQQTIRRDFAHCTVLTVAHRLQTILDADRIVVMKSGEIQEVGVPADLLRNHKSAFYAMAREAGLGSDDRSSGFEHRSSKQSSSGH
ncbi:multidrug resistance-associated protein 1-like isoform X2 [Dermacentor albipictus]|uniref:multidrug resistance-associated protein 1-like isoform X2 n=1 Tax=Dermacentor albipictus TaxID=60249 RepID=UPI0038FC0F20